MKRGKKLMLLALALVVVAGASIVAMKLNPDDEADSSEGEAVLIYSVDPESVTKLGWTYQGESVTLIDAGDGWIYQEDSGFPLDTSYLDTMLTTISEINAAKTIQSVEDFGQYGLEEPACTISVTAGTSSEIKIGDETGLGGQRYLSLGDGNVYLVDAGILDAFSYGLYDIVEKETIPTMSDVRSFVVDDGSGQLVIDYLENSGLAYSSHYTWFAQTQDGYCTLDTELTENLVSQITNLSWVRCVDYQATASDLVEYGLDTPAVTVTVTYVETEQVDTGETDSDGEPVYDTQETERQFVLELGAYVDDYCYGRIAGSQMVYLIDGDICDALLHTGQTDLLPDDILVMDWDTVTGFDIILDGETYSIEKETRETTSEDGETTEEYVYLLNGQEVAMSDILIDLESLNATGSGEELAPTRTEEIRFVFYRDADTYPEVELTFYQYDSTSCLVGLNGETRLFVSRDSVISIVEEINSIVLSQ